MNYDNIVEAVEMADISEVHRLLEHGESPNKLLPNGSTVLMSAGFDGSSEIVKLLLEYGADVNQVDSKGNTALIYTLEAGHFDETHQSCVDFMLNHNADLNITNNEGQTPLEVAKLEMRTEAVEKMNEILEKHSSPKMKI